MWNLVLFTFTILLLTESVLAQFAISDILARYPELAAFRAVLNSSTAFSEQLFGQLSDFTLLAPNNAAIANWIPTLSANVSTTDIDDVLKYHLLFGKYPTANISQNPVPVRSWLTDRTITNVTDGQRVEVFSNSSGVFFESGNKVDSKVVTGDLVGDNGFIHIVDRVLTFPSIFAVTAAETHLSDLISLMNAGNYLRNTNFSWDIATRPDSTFFAPNSSVVLSHLPSVGNQTFYDSLLEYHCVSKLVYSSDFVNGTVLPTFNNKTMMIRIDENGQAYANNAKIIATNYLLSNGVMHILDDIMDPNNITTSSSPTAPPTPHSHTPLSSAARTGIGVGIGATACLLLLALLFLIRQRRRKRAGAKSSQEVSESSVELRDFPPAELQGFSRPEMIEMPGDPGKVWEQEPKTLLGMGGLEPKSLWVQRQIPRTPP